MNPVNEEKLEINVAGKSFGKINSATVLTAPTFNAVNTFEKPDVIVPVALKNVKKLADNKLELSIPGKSVVVLELE